MKVKKKMKVFRSVKDFEKFYFPKSSENDDLLEQKTQEQEDPLQMTKKAISSISLKMKKQIAL